ncbi:MAG: M28 family peptidase [Acidobacteria bacterium]|nr:M28 family peptidase [Acidobacteriota bacterium]
MHRTLKHCWFLALALGVACAQSPSQAADDAGERAFAYVEQLVALGPRPSGSEAQLKQQQVILEALRRLDCTVTEDDFTARTPRGPVAMKNIIADFPGPTGRINAVSGHYDTLGHADVPAFVGANDAGSSAGLLLALAEQLNGELRRDTVRLVFFDGEESVIAWQGDDHTYGSRRLAAAWAAGPERERLQALINVDMVGDANLQLVYEGNSTPWLRDLVWDVAASLGYSRQFPAGQTGYIEDDHVPFVQNGFAAVDLIDFDYGLLNRYWHTEQDTLDKLSPESLGIVLRVVRETLRELEKRP